MITIIINEFLINDNCIIMVSRFSPSKFYHSNTDDCRKVPKEREGMIAGQAAKETIIVCLKVNKQIANFFFHRWSWGGLKCIFIKQLYASKDFI